MSNSIDQRIVEMKFDNAQFEKGIEETIKSLDSLDKSLDLKNTNKLGSDMSSLANATTGIDAVAENISSGRSKIEAAFSSLAEGFGKVTLVTAGATAAFTAITSAFNFSGGWNRALNIENAKFQLKGLGIAWQDVCGDIDYAVQDTAYGLDSAAKAAAQLSASQVALGDDMKAALRGISGVAAMTNSSYDEIAQVFTRVAGNGRVMAVDLRSLAARGLNAAAALAKAFNTTEAEVREMVSRGEIDFNTFASVMDDAFGEHAKEANKTFNGALSNMNAAWSRFWANFLGGTEEDEEGNISGTGGGILNMLRRVFLSIKAVVSDLAKIFAPVAELLQPVTDAIGTFAENISNFIHDLWMDTTKDGDKTVTTIGRLGKEIFWVFRNIGDAITSFGRPFMAFFEALLPTFDEVYKWIISIKDVNLTNRLKLTEGAVRFLETAFSAFGTLVKNIIGPIITGFTWVLDKLIVAFIFVKDALDTFFDALWDFASRGFQSFSDALSGIKNPLDAFFEAVNNSGFKDTALYQFLSKTAETLKHLWNSINYFASNSIRTPMALVGIFFGQILTYFREFLEVTGSKELADNIFNNFITPISNFFKGIGNLLTQDGGAELVFGGIGSIFSSIANGLSQGASIVLGVLGDIVLFVLDKIGYVWELITGFGQGVITFISEIIGRIPILGEAFTKGLAEGFEGADNLEQYADGVENSMGSMNESFKNTGNVLASTPVGKMLYGIGDAFADFAETTKDHAPNIADWTKLFDGVARSVSDFMAWLDPIGRIKSAIEGLKEAFKDFGTDAFQGWGSKFLGDNSGIANLLDNFSTSLSNFWKTIIDNLPTGEQVAEAIGSLGEGFVNVINLLSPLFEGIGRIIGTIGRDAIEFFSNLFNNVSSFAGLDLSGVGDFFSNLFESFNQFTKDLESGNVNIFDVLGEALKTIIDLFGSLINSILPGFQSAISDTGSAVDQSGLTDLADSMLNSLGILAGVSDDSQQIGSELSTSGEGIKDGGGILVDALNWISDNLGVVVGVLAGGALLVTLIKAVDIFFKMGKGIAGLTSSAKVFIDGVNKKLGFSSSTQTKIQQLRELIMSIVYLVGAVAVLTLIPAEKLWPAIGVVAVLGVIVIGMVAAMELIDKKLGSGKSVDHLGTAAEISSIAIAMLAISASLLLVSLIPPDRAFIAAGVIAIMMIAIKMIIKAISTSKISSIGVQLFAAALGIQALGLALLEFTAIIAIFSFIPWGMLIPGIVAVVAELAVLTAVGVILGRNSGNMLRAAAAIMAMGAALAILTYSIITMEAMRVTGSTNYIEDAIVLISLLASLVAAILVLDKIGSAFPVLQQLAKVMMLLGVVMIEIAASLAIVEHFADNAGEMISAMAALVLVLGAMTAALLVLEKFSGIKENALVLFEIAAVLVIVSAAMILVGRAISDILSTQSTWDQMLAAAGSIAIAVAAMTIALIGLTAIADINYAGVIAASAALLIVAAAMWVLADGLNSMQKVSWDSVWQLIAVLAAITIAGAVAGMTVLIAAGILAIGAAILMIGTAVLNAGTGIEKFAVGISILSHVMVPFVEELDAAMGKFAETMRSRFPELLDTFIANAQEFAARMPELIGSIAQAVTSVIVGIAQGLADSVPQVADALLTMMESAIEWMGQNGDRLQDDIIGFANVLGTMLGDAILGILTLITSALGTLLEGIGGMIADATTKWGAEAAKERATAYLDSYSAELEAKGPDKVLEALEAIDKATVNQGAKLQLDTGYDSEEFREIIASLEYILQDETTMNKLTQEQRQHIIELADATANGAVIEMANLHREAENVNEELENVTLTQDDFIKDSEGVMIPYQMLSENLQPIVDNLLPDMDVSVDDLISGMTELGNGSLLDGLSLSMTDASGLMDVLVSKGIITQEQMDSLNLDSFNGAFDGIFNNMSGLKFDLQDTAGVAEVSGEAFATALANGVDVSAMLSSLAQVKAALDETYAEFNRVHVGGSADINALATIVSAQATRMTSDFGRVKSAVSTLGSTISSSLSSAASGSYAVGMNISLGLAKGINAYKWIATQAAYALGADTAKAVKKGADEKSPSKITIEAGKFLAMGLGIGISQNSQYALENAEKLGASTANAVRLSLSGVSDMLGGIDWDAVPVIRPVLDTSGVESGMMLINSMFGSSPALQAAYAYPGSGRIFTGGSPKIYHISVDLNYQAGDDAAALANGLVSKLEDYANLEG